jgi:hypothetical protein
VRLFSAAGRVSVGPAARSTSDLPPQLAAAGYAPEQVRLACASADSDAGWRASPPAAAAAAALLRESSSTSSSSASSSSSSASSSASSSPPPPAAHLVFSWTVDRSAPAPSAHGGPRCAGAAPVALSGASAAELASVLEESAGGGGRGRGRGGGSKKEKREKKKKEKWNSLFVFSREESPNLQLPPRVARLRAANFINGSLVAGDQGTRALFPLFWHLRGTSCVAAPGDAFIGGGGGDSPSPSSSSSSFPADAEGAELARAAVACDAELLSSSSGSSERGAGEGEGEEEEIFVNGGGGEGGGGETISSNLITLLQQQLLREQTSSSSSSSWWRLSCEVVAEDGSALSAAAAERLSPCGGGESGESEEEDENGDSNGRKKRGSNNPLAGPRVVAVLDRVQAGVLGATLSSFGITGLYFTFVLGAVSFFIFFTFFL